METANGLTIDKRGTVEATIEDTGETKTVSWGKIDDPDAENYQDTLGIADATWKQRREEDETIYFVYEREDDTLLISKETINDLPV